LIVPSNVELGSTYSRNIIQFIFKLQFLQASICFLGFPLNLEQKIYLGLLRCVIWKCCISHRLFICRYGTTNVTKKVRHKRDGFKIIRNDGFKKNYRSAFWL